MLFSFLSNFLVVLFLILLVVLVLVSVVVVGSSIKNTNFKSLSDMQKTANWTEVSNSGHYTIESPSDQGEVT